MKSRVSWMNAPAGAALERRISRALVLVGLALILAGVGNGLATEQEDAPWSVVDAPTRGPSAAAEVAAVGLTVSDLDRSVAFFTTVLQFTKISEGEFADSGYERLSGVFGARARRAFLALGEERLELTEFVAPEGASWPLDARSNDASFQHVAIVVSSMSRAYEHLRQHRVRHISQGPQRLPDWNVAAGGIEAFYFRDPDGHPLELIAFPKSKGAPRWHVASDRLFLGIDHTAIVVADTEASLRLYRDVLGFKVVGVSENHGLEQDRLSGVFGAKVRITSLRVERGPGVEFLEYVAPGPGAPFPANARACDIVHRHTTVIVRGLEDLASKLSVYRAGFVAPRPVSHESLDSTASGWRVRDADGHVLQLVEENQ